MAILLNGIFGTLSGTIGNLVFRNLRGVTVVSRRPVRGKKNITRAQLEQQAKFAMTLRLLKPLVPLLRITYHSHPGRMGTFNRAFSDNIRNAISGGYPAYRINWPALQLSNGNLPALPVEVMAGRNEGTLDFRWHSGCGQDPARAGDRIWVAVYCEELDLWEFKTDGAPRKEGRWSFHVQEFRGRFVKVYTGFVSANGKLSTRSSYAGPLEVV
jgi:hypothetical protein